MWQCIKCREQVDDGFDVCWNCGTSSDGTEDSDFRRAEEIRTEEMEPSRPVPEQLNVADELAAIREISAGDVIDREMTQQTAIFCSRCDRELDFVGTKSFHEGFQWGVFGDLAELFVNKEAFDLYVCRRCGRVEFFVSGVGEQFRSRKTTD